MEHFTYGSTEIRLTSSFSETTKAGRMRREIFKALRERNHQSRMLYPVKPFFKRKGEIRLSQTNKN